MDIAKCGFIRESKRRGCTKTRLRFPGPFFFPFDKRLPGGYSAKAASSNLVPYMWLQHGRGNLGSTLGQTLWPEYSMRGQIRQDLSQGFPLLMCDVFGQGCTVGLAWRYHNGMVCIMASSTHLGSPWAGQTPDKRNNRTEMEVVFIQQAAELTSVHCRAARGSCKTDWRWERNSWQ